MPHRHRGRVCNFPVKADCDAAVRAWREAAKAVIAEDVAARKATKKALWAERIAVYEDREAQRVEEMLAWKRRRMEATAPAVRKAKRETP